LRPSDPLAARWQTSIALKRLDGKDLRDDPITRDLDWGNFPSSMWTAIPTGVGLTARYYVWLRCAHRLYRFGRQDWAAIMAVIGKSWWLQRNQWAQMTSPMSNLWARINVAFHTLEFPAPPPS